MVQLKERALAASGALFVVLVMLGNSLNTVGISQSTHPSGAQVLKDVAVQHGSTSARLGFVLEGLSFICLIVFIGFLRTRIKATAAGAIALVAGTVLLAVKLGSGTSTMTLMADRATLSPDIASVLSDMNSMSFILGWLPFAVLTWAAAVGLRSMGSVGRPTAYLGIALGVLGVLAGLAGLDAPVDANPMPFLLSLVWMLVVSVRLAVGTSAQAPVAVSSIADEYVDA